MKNKKINYAVSVYLLDEKTSYRLKFWHKATRKYLTEYEHRFKANSYEDAKLLRDKEQAKEKWLHYKEEDNIEGDFVSFAKEVSVEPPTTSCTGTGTITTYGGAIQDSPQGAGVGAPSGADNTGFGYLVFSGAACGGTLTTGADNTGVGYKVLNKVTSGYQNVGVGSVALLNDTSGEGNTAVGYNSLNSNTNGIRNTASGIASLTANTTGSNNTASGAQALQSNTKGIQNTAIGEATLYTNTTGSCITAVGAGALGLNTADYNTAVGDSALTANTTGTNNVAEGYGALATNSTGSYNNAIGYEALAYNVYAGQNVAVGYQALYKQSYGSSAWNSFNTAIGDLALYSNQPTSTSNGSQNTAVGDSAMFHNTTGTKNSAVGYQSLVQNTTGQHNVADGVKAMYSNTTGGNNSAFGNSALVSNPRGSCNTACGFAALGDDTGSFNTVVGDSGFYNNIGGTYNTAIGYQTSRSAAAAVTNCTVIGYGAAVNGSNTIQLGNNNVAGLYFGNGGLSVGVQNIMYYNPLNGQITRAASSRRYKKNITDLKMNSSSIYKLRPVSYIYKADSTNTPTIGLIAEEVAPIIPELVAYIPAKRVIKGNTSDSLIPDAVHYELLSVLLLKEVQKHEKTIAEQQQMMDSLKAENMALRVQLNQEATSQTHITQQQASNDKEIAELKNVLNSLMKTSASVK